MRAPRGCIEPLHVWCRHRRTYTLDNEHRLIFQPTTAAPADGIFKIPSVKPSYLVIRTYLQRDFLFNPLVGAAETFKVCMGRKTVRLV